MIAHQLRGASALLRLYRTAFCQRKACPTVKKHQFQTSASQFSKSRLTSKAPLEPIFDTLRDRGFINQVTGEKDQLKNEIDSNRFTIYAGVDPTAPAVHLGNLVTMMPLVHLLLAGHNILLILGDATARIGDPSGRSTERRRVADEDLRSKNNDAMRQNLVDVFENVVTYARLKQGKCKAAIGTFNLRNNGGWLEKMTVPVFLQQVGHYVRIGQMMARESVKARLQSAEGINYAEFSYQIIQAYDFWHLYHSEGCRLQIGGSDQWGNITAGIDLINKTRDQYFSKEERANIRQLEAIENIPKEEDEGVFGLTVPLLTTASGEKFGKSAGNAIWLHPSMTSPLDLYQFLLQIADADVSLYLKTFTFLDLEEVHSIVKEHTTAPEKRIAQKRIAYEVVAQVHTKEMADNVIKMTQYFFNKDSIDLGIDEIKKMCSWNKTLYREVKRGDIVANTINNIGLLLDIAESKSAVEKLVKNNGLSYGKSPREMKKCQRLMKIDEDMLLNNELLFLKAGKNSWRIISVVN